MRIGFDVGGTFTDVVFFDDAGRFNAIKTLSLMDRLGDDIAELVEQRVVDPKDRDFVHGTTIASNALIEGKTARTGLLTTAGFRDVFEMRGQRRPSIYDVNWERRPALVRRAQRLEIEERILGDGSIDKPIDRDEVAAAVRRLVEAGVDSIAVCFINAYLNPAHERVAAEVIEKTAPGLRYCLSSSHFAEVREYERTSTTVVNAALMPIAESYLTRLEQQLRVPEGSLMVMQSTGGLMSSATTRVLPVSIIASGPAAGVLAAARLATEVGLRRVLCFDMGGTTAKASFVDNGKPIEKAGSEVGTGTSLASRWFGGEGHAVRIPSIDIIEVGAGGGSIAWIDAGGALRVGPEGAGADPGPACYRRGGERPTVTDANVALGYINPTAIADGTIPIDRAAGMAAFEREVAHKTGLPVLDAAFGMLRIADATMMRALRAATIERGEDPRDMTIVAYGGSGPLHAARLAESLGVSRVYIPPYPGLFSAIGLLLADFQRDEIQGAMISLDEADPDALAARFAMLEKRIRSAMTSEVGAGRPIGLSWKVDLQYRHQDAAITVDWPADPASVRQALRAEFGRLHRALYGFERDDGIDIVSLRVRAVAEGRGGRITELSNAAPPATATVGEREAYFGKDVGMRKVALMSRGAIKSERGPLIIEEPDTSVLVPPGWHVASDEHGNLVLTRC